MIAYCGLSCPTCAIYLATRETDAEKKMRMREEIAREIAKHYGTETCVEDVTDCDGCATEGGRLFSGCRKCRVRKCAKEKALDSCAHCNTYPCADLDKLFATDLDAKRRLDAIRAGSK